MFWTFSAQNTQSNSLSETPSLPAKEMKKEMPPLKKKKQKITQENVFTTNRESQWDQKRNYDYRIEMDAETIIKLCK